MGKADYLEWGTWNATCSICGGKFKANQMRKHWTGFWRCVRDWDFRQPQDFVKGIADIQTVPWSQPPTETFINICTLNGLSAIPDWAIPDCALPDRTTIDPTQSV